MGQNIHPNLEVVLNAASAFTTVTKTEFLKSSDKLDKIVSTLSTEQLYALVLWLQVRRNQNDDLFFLSTSVAWELSRHVIDLGCGPGFSLQLLHSRFPEKSYAGIDLSPEFSELARSVCGIPITTGDISHFKPEVPFDFGMLTAVLQHMPNDEGFLKNLPNIVRKDGFLLILDADSEQQNPSATRNPSVTLLDKMYADLSHLQKGRRFAISDFAQRLIRDGWTVVHSELSGVAISKDDEKLTFAKEEYVRCNLIAQLLGPTIPTQELHSSLANWLKSPNSFAVGTGRRILLQRSRGTP